MAKTLYFDCFSGASGDMILGALLDLGLPIEALRGALGSLAIEYGEVTAERVTRAGVTATKFRLIEKAGRSRQRAGQHKHHHLKHIVAAIRRSALTAVSQDRAVQLFERLAEAEAAIHNTPIERVHLHEVGALDSIIDIVGAVYGFEWFGIEDIVSSPLNVGGGTVHCAHGVFPVPAPATARLLLNAPVYGNGTSELVTPTGALLVTAYAREFGPLPAMRLERIGYGAGDRDPKDAPNVLRMVLGERAAATAERIVTIECEIDDMNPQLFGPLMDRLSRPARSTCSTRRADEEEPARHAGDRPRASGDARSASPPCCSRTRRPSASGIRRCCAIASIGRSSRSRRPSARYASRWRRRDGRVLNAAPEFDDCARIAAERGLPIKDVQAIATRAWLDSRD